MIALRLTEEARDDIADAIRWSIEEWGAVRADRYRTRLLDRVYSLKTHPNLGTACDGVRQGYRRLTAQRHVVFYQVSDTEVIVVRVLHHSMDHVRHLGG